MKSTSIPLILLVLLPLLVLSSPTPITVRQTSTGSTTENGLTTDPCKALTVIFARGTNEPGNVGDVAGPPFFSALRGTLGTASVTVQGVDYGASVLGYLEGGDPTGSATMLSLIEEASTKCPNTELVIAGYSQGAQLVHNAAAKLSAAITDQIVAVVLFGDPDHLQPVGTIPNADVDSICHNQDIICTGEGGFTTHLTYGTDGPSAAAFVVKVDGVRIWLSRSDVLMGRTVRGRVIDAMGVLTFLAEAFTA